VIINSHNFTPPFNAAVNGKMPVGAWVPSRDTVGNGTTTLRDLVGSANGTLTNMDAATDWVADTDAGGVKALDFDGSNDYVITSALPIAGSITTLTVVGWMKPTNITQIKMAWCIGNEATGQRRGMLQRAGQLELNGFLRDYRSNSSVLVAGAWQQVGFTINGASTATAITLYRNGAAIAGAAVAGTFGNLQAFTDTSLKLAANNSGTENWLGRLDDVRVFDQVLTDADFATLYASGLGRGYQS
jgi:hypothetical protein